jgi:hypothetical protein
VLLGLVIDAIIIVLFNNLTPDYIEEWGEITGVLLFILLFIQTAPFIFNFLTKMQKDISMFINNKLYSINALLKELHVSTGFLLIGIVILHIISNIKCNDFELDIDVIMGIVTGIFLMLSILYGFINIIKPYKYYRQHVLFSILTLLSAIIHLIG